MIREQVEAQAATSGDRSDRPDLLDEVTGLVEWPVALTGSFEERFLQVPAEALVSSMKEHQKYFHLVDARASSSPISSPSPISKAQTRHRLSRAMSALSARDCPTPLSSLKPTKRHPWQAGSTPWAVSSSSRSWAPCKTRPTHGQAGGRLAPAIGAPVELAQRAALLSKADLVTDMVLEFSDMQGIAGSYYALHDGEEPDVASALAQQYWPKFAGDRLPETATACTLGLADRLDTLVGIFGIGQPPTGSKDPFALRRASLAVLRIIVEKELDLDLRECLELAAAQYPRRHWPRAPPSRCSIT